MHAVTRFAPSPTGRLHLGHAYSALLAHDFARERGRHLPAAHRGYRSRPVPRRIRRRASSRTSLWLGLEWDGECACSPSSSTTTRAALDRLEAEGLLYPCFCTRADIAAEIAAAHAAPQARHAGLSRHLPPARDRRPLSRAACLAARRRHGDGAGPAARLVDGRTPRSRPEPARTATSSSPARMRHARYHLAVTIDDAAAGRHRRRARRDLFAATDVHRLLQAAARPADAALSSPRSVDGRRRPAARQAPRCADARRPARRGAPSGGAGGGALRGKLPAGYSRTEASEARP